MKYALLMYQEDAHSQPGTPEHEVSSQAWDTMGPELQEVLAAGNYPIGLAPVGNATTVRVRAGQTLTTDGPFAETHEQLAGMWVFDCPDLDEALMWAARIPTAQYGSVEVRPLWPGD